MTRNFTKDLDYGPGIKEGRQCLICKTPIIEDVFCKSCRDWIFRIKAKHESDFVSWGIYYMVDRPGIPGPENFKFYAGKFYIRNLKDGTTRYVEGLWARAFPKEFKSHFPNEYEFISEAEFHESPKSETPWLLA